MLGRRPEKERGKLKRKWEEEEVEDGNESGDEKPPVTETEVKEWRDREELEEKKEEQEEKKEEELKQPLPPSTPPPPSGILPSGGLRLGEGDDSGRSQDEIRIVKEMLEQDIVRFGQENKVDVPALRELRNEPVAVQFSVLDRGNLLGCNNPSGALIGRIRDAKRAVMAKLSGAPAAVPPAGTPAAPPAALSLLNQSSLSSPGIEMCGDFKKGVCTRGDACRYSHGGAVPTSRPGVQAVAGGIGGIVDIDKFSIENRLDPTALLALRSEPKEVQEKVVAMGPLVGVVYDPQLGASNSSAALMGRIRQAKTMLGSGALPPPPPGTPISLPSNLAAVPPPPPPKAPPGAMIDMNAEALKAVQSLERRNGVDPQIERSTVTPVSNGNLGDGAKIGDNKLNEEAMKAIAMMNNAL